MHFRESRKEIENKMETKSRKMKFTDLKDMLNQTGEVYGDRPAYIFKTEEKGKFRTITHKEFRENINALGTTLIQMGLKDKRIALISENRYEWELSYLAVASGVGTCILLYDHCSMFRNFLQHECIQRWIGYYCFDIKKVYQYFNRNSTAGRRFHSCHCGIFRVWCNCRFIFTGRIPCKVIFY